MGDRSNVFTIYTSLGGWNCCIPGFGKEAVKKAELPAAAFDSEKQQPVSKSGVSSFEIIQVSVVRRTLTSVIYPKRFLIIVTSYVPADWE